MFRTISTAAPVALLASALVLSLPQGSEGSALQTDEGLMESLREVEIDMAAVAEHAAKLEQMAEWPNLYTKTAHEYEWASMKTRFNEAGEKVPALQSATGAKPWQKQIVDEIASLMKALDAQIESGTKILQETAAVERLHADRLYAVRIRSAQRYAEMIDDMIELVQDRREPTS